MAATAAFTTASRCASGISSAAEKKACVRFLVPRGARFEAAAFIAIVFVLVYSAGMLVRPICFVSIRPICVEAVITHFAITIHLGALETAAKMPLGLSACRRNPPERLIMAQLSRRALR